MVRLRFCPSRIVPRVAGVVAIVLPFVWLSCWPTTVQAGSGRSIQIPGSSRSSKSLETSDSDSDEGWSWSRRSSNLGSGVKSGTSSYQPERIKRFWSHYHGARPEQKRKPLERQK